MNRRTFIAGLGSAAACPAVLRAQQGDRMRTVGVLFSFPENDAEGQAAIGESLRRLGELGWVEGRNVHFDVRWAGIDVARQREYARELAALAPDVILVNGTTATQAVRDATRTIPVVFVNLSDPVATGVVSNLARPEANLTGFSAFEYSLGGRWLSLLKEMVPQLSRVAALFNPNTAPFAPFYLRAIRDATDAAVVKFAPAGVSSATGIEVTMAALAGSDVGGLVVVPDVFNNANSAKIIEIAARYRVPTIYYDRFFVADGGLISYGPNERLQYGYGANYVDRILRGAKPGDLPVQLPTKFEMVVNLKTAKALGLTIPETLLATADEVIQ
jgi:putative tryptophan/tyrosine transport system substrate-binding protein